MVQQWIEEHNNSEVLTWPPGFSDGTVTNIWLDRARYQGASSEDRAVLVLKEAPKQYQACFA